MVNEMRVRALLLALTINPYPFTINHSPEFSSMDLTFQPRFDCQLCPTRCDGRSKSAYVFEDDVALSEAAEDWLAGHLATCWAWMSTRRRRSGMACPTWR